MSSPAPDQLLRLRHSHPEWSPWLTVIEEVICAANDRRWEEAVPRRPRREDSKAPWLMRASITISEKLSRQWIELLFVTAAKAGTMELATLSRAGDLTAKATTSLHAALTHNTALLDAMARDCSIDTGAYRSLAQLLPVPLLHACRRIWSEGENENWIHSYCPLCGAWPALAEVRGIERSSYLRCGRCGEQWPAQALRCVFCGMDEHEQLLSLITDTTGATRSVEACKSCSGYLKTFAVLRPGDGPSVLLDDLASVDLDIAAIEQGFSRPDGLGHPIEPTIAAHQPVRLFSSLRGT